MKKLLILFIALSIFSCTNDKHKTLARTDTITVIKTDTVLKNHLAHTSADPKQQLIGQWKEHWGVGVETNVNSNDVYEIQLSKDGILNISSSNKSKYKIDKILFDGHELSFRKQNLFYPRGKFYVYYKLKLHDDFKWMEGPITNNKKQKDFVKWEKVDLEN